MSDDDKEWTEWVEELSETEIESRVQQLLGMRKRQESYQQRREERGVKM